MSAISAAIVRLDVTLDTFRLAVESMAKFKATIDSIDPQLLTASDAVEMRDIVIGTMQNQSRLFESQIDVLKSIRRELVQTN